MVICATEVGRTEVESGTIPSCSISSGGRGVIKTAPAGPRFAWPTCARWSRPWPRLPRRPARQPQTSGRTSAKTAKLPRSRCRRAHRVQFRYQAPVRGPQGRQDRRGQGRPCHGVGRRLRGAGHLRLSLQPQKGSLIHATPNCRRCGLARARKNRHRVRPAAKPLRPVPLAKMFFDEPKAVAISKSVLRGGAS